MAPVSAARTSADPLSAIPLLLDRVRVIRRIGSFGNSRFGSSTHLFGSSRFNSFGGHNGFGNRGFGRSYGWHGNGWHGNGWHGNRYGGFGWRGYGWNRGYWPGYYNYGWGGGFFGAGFGGWGFGVGWPYWGSYWGPGWAFGWDPWWYNPYWYSPWPSYNYYQNYPDIGYNNPPSDAPDALSDYDSSSSYLITPTLDPEALHFNVNGNAGLDDNGSDQTSQPAQPEAAPGLRAPATTAQPRLVLQPTT